MKLQLLLLLSLSLISAIRIENFVDFDLAHDDTLMQPDHEESDLINLQFTLPFFQHKYNRLWINRNGVISLEQKEITHTPQDSTSYKMVTPFWADVQTFPWDSGKVYYRQTRALSVLESLAKDIKLAYPEIVSFNLTNALVITWFNVSFYGVSHCQFHYESPNFWPRNTFQAVLTTDEIQTFAVFNYDKILWTTGNFNSGNCSGFGGTPALIGFSPMVGNKLEKLPESGTIELLTIVNKSNMGVPGKFIFQFVNRANTQQVINDTITPTNATYTPTTVKQPNKEPDCALTYSSNCMTTTVSIIAGVMIILLLILIIFLCYSYQQRQIGLFGILKVKRFSGLR